MSSGSISFSPPRGMRDFYPDDMVLREAIFDAWRTAARRSGFSSYDACVVESLDLLKRKAGEEIVDQIYCFKDKSDRDLALRAEMTPTLARMVAARQSALPFPLKWYTIAQCFRYERMTRGRKREHYQWNLDIIGEAGVAAEAEVVATAIHALRILGLDANDYRVRFSSRALLADLLRAAGIPAEHHAATFLALDKRGKVPDAAIRVSLEQAGVGADHVEAVFDLLEIGSVDDARGRLDAATPALTELQRFVELMVGFGCGDMLTFDISVIRGLAYYTGIVFEAFDTAGSLRAIFGGGRYDNLLGDVGGRPETGVGLGFGDVVISELLQEKGKATVHGQSRCMAVGYMEEAQRVAAVSFAARTRAEGENVDLALQPEKPGKFFARTSKAGFARAAYVGPDDAAAGSVRVKDLVERTEETRPLA